MLQRLRILVFSALLALTAVGFARAAPSYVFELYSSADGSVQFIMLFTGNSVRAGQTLAARPFSSTSVDPSPRPRRFALDRPACELPIEVL
jgi:hypothetical protein